MALAAEYDNMLRCIRCAACLTSCPTYVISHKEEEGPRGRIAIMRAIVEGHLEVTPDALEHVGNCLLCEACSHVCPSGVDMESLGVAFREEVRGRRTLGERFAYGWLFGDLGHFRLAARLMRFYQRSGLQWLARHLGILRLLGLADMERLLPPIPARFIVPNGRTWPAEAVAGNEAGAVEAGVVSGAQGRWGEPAQVFAGCIMSTAFAPTTEHTAELLGAFGCEASFPEGQVCCGALQLHAGETERARELARANLAAFDGEAPVVVNAAGCGAMLKHYGKLLPEDRRAAAFVARVRDVSEFLAERQPCHAPRAIERKVVVQDACHLLHAQRVDRAPRQLLAAIPGLELRSMAEAGICCGSAGVYNVTHREAGDQLQRRKCENIVASGADTVVTGNPDCLLQMRAGLRGDAKVEHLVDLLWEAYR